MCGVQKGADPAPRDRAGGYSFLSDQFGYFLKVLGDFYSNVHMLAVDKIFATFDVCCECVRCVCEKLK